MGRLGELLVLVSIIVVMFGWRRLPGIGSSLKSSLKSFHKGLEGQEDDRATRDLNEIPPPEKSNKEKV